MSLRVRRRQAVEWAVRAIAVAAALWAIALGWAFAVSSPAPAPAPAMAAAVVAGAALGLGGWIRSRPSSDEVARLADGALGGAERIATALELSRGDPGTAVSVLAPYQQADTEAWLAGADPHRVTSGRLPRGAVTVAVAGLVMSTVVLLLPERGLERARAGAEAEAAREAAADELAVLASSIAADPGGQARARRLALVRELRNAEMELRSADDPATAVAALSRSQLQLRTLANPARASRRSAAAGAGAALARSGAAGAAGAALAAAGRDAAGDLAAMADLAAEGTPQERAGAAADLGQAAQEATDPGVSDALRRAAEAIEAGQADLARDALSEAGRRVNEANDLDARQALADLAEVLPSLNPEERFGLQEALDQAAAAAGADRELAEALRSAAESLGGDELVPAADALRAAAGRAAELSAESDLDNLVAAASGTVGELKDGLLAAVPGSCEPPPGGAGHGPRHHEPTTGEPATGEPPIGEPGELADRQFDPDACIDAGVRSPGAEVPGAGSGGGAQGEGQGEGEGIGKGQGQAQGGQGQAAGGGGGGLGQAQGDRPGRQNSGGSASGGAQGGLSAPPGQPNEQVFVAGTPGAGRSRQLGSAGEGQGGEGALVPYERVYGQYRSQALGEADRQVVPDGLREVLRRYFGEGP